MKENQITYTNVNGINYPDLKLPEQSDVSIGKYGMMRLEFLKNHYRDTYTTLLTECRLTDHLYETDVEAHSQVELLTAKLAKQRGINENLKATNPLLWVQEMNNCLGSAEEVVLWEMIYRQSFLIGLCKFFNYTNMAAELDFCRRCLFCHRIIIIGFAIVFVLFNMS